jgi:hypothetical protein
MDPRGDTELLWFSDNLRCLRLQRPDGHFTVAVDAGEQTIVASLCESADVVARRAEELLTLLTNHHP